MIFAFVSGCVVDAMHTACFYATQNNKAFLAGTTAALAQLLAIFVFVEVTRDISIAVPYVLGVWISGTIGVRIKARLEKVK